MLVVFEGIDGCGKGTQVQMLAEAIRREGWGDRVVLNKQPGATRLGQSIRDLLFHSITTHEMEPDAASLLFFAAHVQSLHDVVMPALAAGKIVISDRWCAYSDVAFGLHGLERPISPALVKVRNALGGPAPDLLFFMHGNPATFLDRALARSSEKHEAGKAWAHADTLDRIQQEYFRIFEPMVGDPGSGYCPIDADQAPELIFETIVWRRFFSAMRRHFDLD